MEPNVKILELKTPRDFKRLSSKLDKAIELVIEHEYGFYDIQAADRHVWTMVANLEFLKERFNKGVKIQGGFNTRKIEIYDVKKQREEIDKSLDGFYL